MPLLPRSSSLAAPIPRAEFSQAEFTQLIENYGMAVRWSKFLCCPNMDISEPSHHMVGCTYCDHAGRLFYDPQIIRMFASSYAHKPMYGQESRYDPGTVYFTTLPGCHISYRDKIEMLTTTIRTSERVVLGAGLTYKLRFPATCVLAVIDNSNVAYSTQTVLVNADGSLTFASLPAGQFVSVAYDHHPVYTVVDVLHVVRDSRTTVEGADTPTEFSRQVVAQMEFTRDVTDPNGADLG
jgi:hypothetical protein